MYYIYIYTYIERERYKERERERVREREIYIYIYIYRDILLSMSIGGAWNHLRRSSRPCEKTTEIKSHQKLTANKRTKL